MPNKNFDRRAFLKGAALAGVAPAAQAAPPVRKWDHEADVVVVGSGDSGPVDVNLSFNPAVQ